MVLPSAERVLYPFTRVEPLSTANVFWLTVLASRGFEKVSTTVTFGAWPLAPWEGVTEVTTGGVGSDANTVVKLVVKYNEFPLRSVRPDWVTVIVVFSGYGNCGVNVMTLPLAEMVPGIVIPFPDTYTPESAVAGL